VVFGGRGKYTEMTSDTVRIVAPRMRMTCGTRKFLLVSSGSDPRARSQLVKEWHKCARVFECKRGSSDGITARLRYADTSRAVYRQATA